MKNFLQMVTRGSVVRNIDRSLYPHTRKKTKIKNICRYVLALKNPSHF